MSEWFWSKHTLDQKRGSQVFQSLFIDQPGISTLLESPFPGTSSLSRYSICATSPNSVWQPNIGEIFPFLESLLTQKRPYFSSPLPNHLPFVGGWLGWLGYDAAWEIEKLPYLKQDSLPFPVACWYEPESFAVLDHWEQIVYIASSAAQKLEFFTERLSLSSSNSDHLAATTADIHFLTSKNEYLGMVAKAKEYIKAGDIFQANLSLRFQRETKLHSWQIYKNLQTINPSPFASYWQTQWGDIVSCSPERLIELRGNIAQTRPIAGTRPRGQTLEEDQRLESELFSNVKERAEHIMLVDLKRNDLGRVCQWGSVQVNEFLTVERYSHVMHLVSNIQGILKSSWSPVDLIRAMFPGGTITGCPKVRCLEIIEELEPQRRSLFYGSAGYLDYRGQLDLNILIRTLLVTQTAEDSLYNVWGQVGAGIVADSDPIREWEESLQKATAQIKALNKTD